MARSNLDNRAGETGHFAALILGTGGLSVDRRTVWTTVVAAQSQQQDQATLERGQTMAVSTHNAVAVSEAAGQLLDVKVGRLRSMASAGCSRRKG